MADPITNVNQIAIQSLFKVKTGTLLTGASVYLIPLTAVEVTDRHNWVGKMFLSLGEEDKSQAVVDVNVATTIADDIQDVEIKAQFPDTLLDLSKTDEALKICIIPIDRDSCDSGNGGILLKNNYATTIRYAANIQVFAGPDLVPES